MPNGDVIANKNSKGEDLKFLDIRSMYLDSSKCQGAKTSDEAIALVKELQAAYDKDVANGAKWSNEYSASDPEGQAELAGFENIAAVDLKYHRFWHAGDIMMALGAMAELYPDLTPDSEAVVDPTTEPTTVVDPTTEPTTDPGKVKYGDVNVDDDVTISDVITLNKYLLGDAECVSAQGLINADVDVNKTIDSTDSLNILKACVQLLDADKDFPIK